MDCSSVQFGHGCENRRPNLGLGSLALAWADALADGSNLIITSAGTLADGSNLITTGVPGYGFWS
jgi:hypothetical protein